MKTNGEQIVTTKKLGIATYLGYAAGDAGCNLAFAGRMVDMTSTRWGKFRPFLLFGSLPLLLLSMATFSVPGWLSDGWRLVYAYATYALVGLAYSLVNIPYGSMAPALTQVPEERARLAAFRSMGSAATVLMLAWVVAPQIKRYIGNPAGFCCSYSPS